jgi:hypothetical protein
VERSAGSKQQNSSVFGVVESRCVVMDVSEKIIDAVEVSAGVCETFNDAINDGHRIVAFIVAEALLTVVGLGDCGGECVDGPGEFAECANHARQIRRQHIVVVTEVITRCFHSANRRIEKINTSGCHRGSGGS